MRLLWKARFIPALITILVLEQVLIGNIPAVVGIWTALISAIVTVASLYFASLR